VTSFDWRGFFWVPDCLFLLRRYPDCWCGENPNPLALHRPEHFNGSAHNGRLMYLRLFIIAIRSVMPQRDFKHVCKRLHFIGIRFEMILSKHVSNGTSVDCLCQVDLSKEILLKPVLSWFAGLSWFTVTWQDENPSKPANSPSWETK